MMTLLDYLKHGTDSTTLRAAALTADEVHVAMIAAALTFGDFSDETEAAGDEAEGATLRRAVSWLVDQTLSHQATLNELKRLAGPAVADECSARRRELVDGPAVTSGPLFDLATRYARLALHQAHLAEVLEQEAIDAH